MRVYLDVAIVLNFIVDLLLILGTNRLSGFPLNLPRAALGALIGSLYGGACLLPGLRFLGGWFWRLVFLGIMGLTAFGLNKSGVRRCSLFAMLAMALGGLAYGIGSRTFPAILLAAGGLCAMCVLGFRGRPGERQYVPVVLEHHGRKEKICALRDTGNTLRDPLTGESVLVVSADVARRFFGLRPEQLALPVETLTKCPIPGLRLIPYRAVGCRSGMLLAVRFDKVLLDGVERSTLVAFSPEGLDNEGAFQALAGGAV